MIEGSKTAEQNNSRTEKRKNTSSQLALRTESSKKIARMREQWLMDKSQLNKNKIIFRDMDQKRVVNSFRELRTKILHEMGEENSIVMVTAAVEGGGSSMVALNLAAAFSFDEGKTGMFIDCSQAARTHYDVASFDGVTDYLSNEELDIEDIIHPVGLERLRMIPAGTKVNSPREFFTSVKMRELLTSVRERYPDRYIIVDAPPILETADAHILAELCDYVLLVVPYGRVTEHKVLSAAREIGEKKLLGVVFNDEPQLPKLSFKKFFGSLMSIKTRTA